MPNIIVPSINYDEYNAMIFLSIKKIISIDTGTDIDKINIDKINTIC